ncbi:DedA family protein [Planomicrobium sp. CPCC 101110]|uniref:DedA family protein n=1 Tax=Planomicrobium sp. CPCC 101110 TaxID=2599619 RepID=UPI0011B7D393|nr:DedA family protein [Planomicrobium sp. CPCC 101110]TWT25723.1 DedA family protein [Planomicrobium sp. CPCC 101110]
MDIDILVKLADKFGYFAMFLFNWILVLGVPLPNELAAAFSGVLTEIRSFNPVYAYIAAYLGLISSNTFAFFIGQVFGHRLLVRLDQTLLKKSVERFSAFLEKHGRWAISFSFFLPGIRWAMPYVVGANRFPFFRYVLYAYPAGSLWLLIYFNIGRAFPFAYEKILGNLQAVLVSLSGLIILFFLVRYLYQSKIARK